MFRTRPGERVAKRRRCQTKVGSSHKIKRDETVKWFKNRFEYVVFGLLVMIPYLPCVQGYRQINSRYELRSMGYGVNQGEHKGDISCTFASTDQITMKQFTVLFGITPFGYATASETDRLAGFSFASADPTVIKSWPLSRIRHWKWHLSLHDNHTFALTIPEALYSQISLSSLFST